MNLHLLLYNNYYNRKVKRESAFEGYSDFVVFTHEDVNFVPNDGITTEAIIGGPVSYNGEADYCIVEENGDIISRWFVIESKRNLGGQYTVTLKRDTIADYYDEIVNAPCFIEKGWVSSNDSAIFNKENMTFNQVKVDEKEIKDKAGIPWLVGYYAKGKELTASVSSLQYAADYTVAGIENWTYYSNYTSPSYYLKEVQLTLNFKIVNPDTGSLSSSYASSNFYNISDRILRQTSEDATYYSADGMYYSIDRGDESGVADANIIRDLRHKLGANVETIMSYSRELLTDGYITETYYEALSKFAETEYTIFDSNTGILYKIGVNIQTGIKVENPPIENIPLTSSLGYIFYNIYSEVDGIKGNNPVKNDPNVYNFYIKSNVNDKIQLTLTPISTAATSIILNPLASAQPLYAPYNIFAIPYTDNLRVGEGGSEPWMVYQNKSLSLRIVNALIEKYGGNSGELYDVQLLPYCPIAEVNQNISGANKKVLNLSLIPSELWGRITDEENNPVGVFFNCNNTSIQTTSEIVINIDDYKIENETSFCRLVSPNWNGIYEFTPAKNRGVEYFEIDMELKPYSPYIHVAPKFNRNGLYGNRDNDPIGLICGGDFGLTMVNDAWQSYQRQNKNYQQIFDRQIQNLEVQQKYQRINDIVGAAVGTASGVASGAMTGAFMGGGVGAVIGGVAGGGISAIGGAADYYINEQLRGEAIDYTKDLFGYQLGNIRALPDSLTKVNSFNPNNTIFPILEYYSCTEEEKEALRNKIKYNGMSIGRIGKIADYTNPEEDWTYIKGQMILLENLSEDSHLAVDIANEIYKGVRI